LASYCKERKDGVTSWPCLCIEFVGYRCRRAGCRAAIEAGELAVGVAAVRGRRRGGRPQAELEAAVVGREAAAGRGSRLTVKTVRRGKKKNRAIKWLRSPMCGFSPALTYCSGPTTSPASRNAWPPTGDADRTRRARPGGWEARLRRRPLRRWSWPRDCRCRRRRSSSPSWPSAWTRSANGGEVNPTASFFPPRKDEISSKSPPRIGK